VSSEVRRYFGDKVFQTVITRNVRLSEAPSHGKPVLLYDALSIGTKNYMDLATEILGRDGYLNDHLNGTGPAPRNGESLRNIKPQPPSGNSSKDKGDDNDGETGNDSEQNEKDESQQGEARQQVQQKGISSVR
jgi:chromosome partitioning protein